MAQTKVVIHYDLASGAVRRIDHPDDDSQLVHHRAQPEHGWGRVLADHSEFPIQDGQPLYDLHHCQLVVNRLRTE